MQSGTRVLEPPTTGSTDSAGADAEVGSVFGHAKDATLDHLASPKAGAGGQLQRACAPERRAAVGGSADCGCEARRGIFVSTPRLIARPRREQRTESYG